MGDAFSHYFTGTLEMLRYFSQGGHAFTFYWTLNSLALFGLLAIACVRVGGGLFACHRRPLETGDRLILVGVLFALVALRAGLNRSDQWHLAPPFLVLLFAFLLLPPTRVFAAHLRGSQRIALALIGVVSATQLVGIAPTGSFYAAGYVRGLVDVLVLSKPPASESAQTRVPTVQIERTRPDPNILGLGEYLAEETRSHKPVFFYNELWLLPIGVGVCAGNYTGDNFMHAEGRQLTRNYLKQNPDALVVIGREAFERLYGLADPSGFPEFERYNPKSLAKTIGSWTSSVHLRGLKVENKVLDRLWKREVGDYIRSRYELDAEFGPLVVLTRSNLG